MNWHPDVGVLLSEDEYTKAVEFYEQLVELEPRNYPNYLYLGLFYLLQKQEEAAQTTWLYLLSQVDDHENQVLTMQLVELLDWAAKQHSQAGDLVKSQLIRAHLRQIDPTNVNNLLESILVTDLDPSTIEILIREFQLVHLLESQAYSVCSDLLLEVVKHCITHKPLSLVGIIQACIPYANPKSTWAEVLLEGGYQLAECLPEEAIALCEVCLKLQPDDIDIWCAYSCFCSNHSAPNHQRKIAAALGLKQRCTTSSLQLQGCYSLLREFLMAGYSCEAEKLLPEFKTTLLAQLNETVEIQEINGQSFVDLLVVAASLLQYCQDKPLEHRELQNQIAKKFQTASDQIHSKNIVGQPRQPLKSKKLKIGYIGHTLRTHSVGWLCRWLFKYHDHDQFHISSYCIDQPTEEIFTKIWFTDPSDAIFLLPGNVHTVAQKIREDEIDILIDLDSMTFQSTCAIMAARSAPVQATWLGFDACGLPAIDYFIADPLVLPDNAQEYYQEKIWRLPQTYIAVDGFEVGISDISRDSLNIPAEAVVYYTSQAGSKRNPTNIRLQMQILKAVPNSFLLVKGKGEQGVIREMFTNLANEVGISLDQIRFLQNAPTEFVHRANMRIADVVLDTYPYTGATTTLEALWMGMPVVTKVGQQFAARNSYAFMTNVGVTEGIAYSDEEYVDWGIRLGLERELRHQVMWTLHQSRKTSPLWDAKAFTRQMEAAYKQMWEVYCQS
jgi:predicted O-linked N-acetylglucosamine transferase (SPINDLY family)